MQVLSVKAELCNGCGECETSCAEHRFKVADRAKSAIRVSEPAEKGAPRQIVVCNQCGECIDVCPTKAISRNRKGVVRIDRKLCVGCMACVGFCTIWAMRTHPAELAPFKCVACGHCVDACPAGVLSVQEVETAGPSETEKWAERVAA